MCDVTIEIRNKKTNQVERVPCGKCVKCKKRRASEWSFRLMQEWKQSTSAYFITLTYDTPHLPRTKANYKTIVKRDLQLFFKRLRKAHEPYRPPRSQSADIIRDGDDKGIRYYAVGEYGGTTFRPHYHVILFNALQELIQPAWNLGHVHYGQVSEASVGYTLKYISKQGKIPLHKNDDRTPEFSLMSKGSAQII